MMRQLWQWFLLLAVRSDDRRSRVRKHSRFRKAFWRMLSAEERARRSRHIPRSSLLSLPESPWRKFFCLTGRPILYYHHWVWLPSTLSSKKLISLTWNLAPRLPGITKVCDVCCDVCELLLLLVFVTVWEFVTRGIRELAYTKSHKILWFATSLASHFVILWWDQRYFLWITNTKRDMGLLHCPSLHTILEFFFFFSPGPSFEYW